MSFRLFEQPCTKCGKPHFGPREGGKARGRWLGYDECLKCRDGGAEQVPA
jgi:hypothetical protein